jgi:Holliday junction resolvase RusA-like endonuclease
MFRSAEYMAWLDECEKVIRAAQIAPVRGSYKLLIRARRPDNRRRDIDNIGGKAVNDMLQKTGIVEDDCMCEMIICKWVNYGPDTSVKITPTRGHHELQGRTASALQGGQKADAAKRDPAKESPAAAYARAVKSARGRVGYRKI